MTDIYSIKTTNAEYLCEIVQRGLLSIQIRNPVRILDTASTGKLSLGYTVYSPFSNNEDIRINKWNIVSMCKVKHQHLEFYNKTVALLNTLVIPELDAEVGKFAIEIEQAMKRLVERKEYLDETDSDVVVVPTEKIDRKKLN
jgi:hypothetical protein